MICKGLCVVVALLGLSAVGSDAANILGIFPTNTHSHYVMYGSLMKELARRGHHVTVVNHFPLKYPIDNFVDISLEGTLPALSNNISIDVPLSMSPLDNHFDIITDCYDSCRIGLNHPEVLKLLNYHRKFDLFVTEIFGSECFLPIAYKLGIPSVGIVSSVTLPWVNDMVANPDNPAYVPLYFYPLTQWMNFYERMYNTIMSVFIKSTYDVMSNWKAQEIAEEVLGTLPTIESMAKNFSLILTNSHFSINQVRPFVPQIIEVGGLHINKLNKLPRDIERFMNESTHGVIYFSFGSMVRIESLPKEKLQQIINALGKQKQRVLWKVNATGLPDLPPNIKTSQWMPQLEILCHPSTKLFISHGGLLGSQETIRCGVPILGIPLFADQALNLAELEKRGVGKVIKYHDINEKTMSASINSIIYDKSYSNNMKHLSQLFMDRPQHPMDTAVYWLEYVIKYKGARHLRSAALDLKWYQYLLLDVISCLILGIIGMIFILKFLKNKLVTKPYKCETIDQDITNNNNINKNNNDIHENGKPIINGYTNINASPTARFYAKSFFFAQFNQIFVISLLIYAIYFTNFLA